MIIKRLNILGTMVFLMILFLSCGSSKSKLAYQDRIIELKNKGFELTNLHVHLKGGLTIEEAVDSSLHTGIRYGIAANCGLKFPIQTDDQLYAYLDTIKSFPVYCGMQAEGREWLTIFSAEARESFDYVFTDAMTWTDSKGRRMRLWIPDETFVDDPQEFMEELVSQIEKIATEPIDIYVNPTFLPDTIKSDYDELWTTERINRVINALKINQVALEINCRYKIPSIKIIKAAKDAGIKFTIGTNNTDRNVGNIGYFIEAVDKTGITPEEMWYPNRGN